MSLFESKKLVIPRGYYPSETVALDITDIDKIESRIPEIIRANPITLTELIVDFNIALSKLASVIGRVELEMRDAERSKKEYEAIALIEKAEEFLKTKNQKSTADTREAAVTLDPDVKAARERFDILKATSLFLVHKKEAIEMAYYSAKKVSDLNQITGPMAGGFIERQVK